MEVLSILLGVIFWPTAILLWFRYIRNRKPVRRIRVIGTLLVVGTPILAAISLGKYMFLDEPLVFAVRDENVNKVKSLLSYGADPNASFKGEAALEQAASEGQTEIVRLLLSHGARTNTDAIKTAKKYGYTEIVQILQQAEANQ